MLLTNFITQVSFKHTFQWVGIRLTTFMVIGTDLQPTFPNGIQNAYKNNKGNIYCTSIIDIKIEYG